MKGTPPFVPTRKKAAPINRDNLGFSQSGVGKVCCSTLIT